MRSIAKIMLCACLGGAVALAGCGKKEEKKTVSPSEPTGQAISRKETTVAVPDIVKGKWKAVKIGVTNKNNNKETDYFIDIGSTFTIPNTTLAIKVESFLPHFTMEGTTLTSATNDPKNPAAQVRITEGGKEIFKGWLFALYPTTHAFQHPVYGFSLVDFVPAN
ncbi:hypothetical protein OR1_03233 [Geobacter sp. OR-1]|nr:hypothetical protein OR1_03233 [Geobacter sp. OR-1]